MVIRRRRRRSNQPEHRYEDPTSATVFVVLRRMRAPLITLIVLFAIGVLGLALIPGRDQAGHTVHLTLFDAFYVMSYTATTIGFGETPWPFTVAQRLWVTACIFMSVLGWAYAVGTLLSLVQDHGFRQVRARHRFSRQVMRLREPFLIVAGYGRAGELVVRSFDAMGQQVVVIDPDSARIDELDLGSFRSDVPGVAADAGDPAQLRLAGIDHRYCAGILALTGDDQVNLSVTMAAALLRPDLPVISHTIIGSTAEQMRAFGTPTVIDPFERFGDHLRLSLHSPAGFQLLTWLEAGPGAELPERGRTPRPGRWVVCGFGRFGHELARYLLESGVDLTVIDERVDPDGETGLDGEVEVIQGDAGDPEILDRAGLDTAVGLVAGTDDDVTNLSILAGARKRNDELYLAGRQNRATSAELFDAMHPDALLVPSDVVAHEAYARISSPLLWRFLRHIPGQDDKWSADLVSRLVNECGHVLPPVWKIRLDADRAPAAIDRVNGGGVLLGDLLRRPEDRTRRLHIVTLLLVRADGEEVPAPPMETVLNPGDELLFAGGGRERRGVESTLVVESTAAYVLSGDHVRARLRLGAAHKRRHRNLGLPTGKSQ
ncbi:NAD-binding protein [Gordonia sp. X0973]|uniref:potassium channel family protein n=1 Tax=Gordonia sp. X0973 TaxID=2742602 RepID=UPI000F531659|nr:NAD-binding protein [Gordonia sp. X0973]QKT07180.1 NAD-binding protein [Gordonia sp. X0973]